MSDELLAALRDHAVPLSTTDPDVPLADGPAARSPLADHLALADVVGLGEVTHGTRECVDLKHRLVRYLVAEEGFRTVAFEADVAKALALDAAVRGDGDPAEALADLDMWQWQTSGVRDLLTWLRAFNDGRPADDQVRLQGIDLSDPSVPARPLLALLRRADAIPIPRDLETLAASDGPPDDDADRAHYLDRAQGAGKAVAGRLDDDREAFVAATDETVWALAEHLAQVVVQNCEWHRVRHQEDGPHADGMAARDERMAANVEWCLDADPGDGVVVWAHNSHVQRGTFDDGTAWTDAATMGDHLDDALGDRYCPIGFDAASGRARAQVAGSDGDPEPVDLGDPAAGSLTATLAGLDSPCFLDLAAASADDRVDWGDEQRIRWVGSVFDPETPDAHYQTTDLAASYDGLLVLGESTPTRPVDGD